MLTMKRIDLLSRREFEVAKAFSKGDSYKEIARNMNISPATVRHYLRVIYEKLEGGDKAQMGLVLRASRVSCSATSALRTVVPPASKSTAMT
jgi:DNA-binding NarL/FixJ family response regulator